MGGHDQCLIVSFLTYQCDGLPQALSKKSGRAVELAPNLLSHNLTLKWPIINGK